MNGALQTNRWPLRPCCATLFLVGLFCISGLHLKRSASRHLYHRPLDSVHLRMMPSTYSFIPPLPFRVDLYISTSSICTLLLAKSYLYCTLYPVVYQSLSPTTRPAEVIRKIDEHISQTTRVVLQLMLFVPNSRIASHFPFHCLHSPSSFPNEIVHHLRESTLPPPCVHRPTGHIPLPAIHEDCEAVVWANGQVYGAARLGEASRSCIATTPVVSFRGIKVA